MPTNSRLTYQINRPSFKLVLTFLALSLLFSLLLGLGQRAALADPGKGSQAVAQGNQGIVTSVVKAPIVPDGNVAGAVTDIVVSLDRSLDPAVEGRTLLKGNQIRITLPDVFVNVRGWSGGTIFTAGCAPGGFECNTGILLQGWPQHPIFPMFPPGGGSPPAFYSTSLDGNTFIFTALENVGPGSMLPGPGIKQIHLFALGFDNPGPGFYDVRVEAQTGPGGAWEKGSARVQIMPNVRPSINVTSVFNIAGNPNTIYQQAAKGSETQFPYDFLLWNSNGDPMEGVTVEMVNSHHALMVQGKRTVGHVFIKTPDGATGQEVFTEKPSEAINAPVSGVPTARLTAKFMAGSASGRYEVTFTLNNGNSVTMFVDVD